MALGCAACAPQPAPWPDNYRLTVSRSEPAARAPAFPGTTLRLATLRGPFTVAGQDLFYSLRYRSPVHVARYSQARWAAPPGGMIGSAVEDWLGRSGHWGAVLGPDDSGSADYILRLEIQEFMQVFPAPRESRAVLAVRAVLQKPGGKDPAQRRFAYHRPTDGVDAEAAAAGLNRNLQRLCGDLERWLVQQMDTPT
jgi:cholesterol transport system auxiliary component